MSPASTSISLDDFHKVDLRVGTVLSVEPNKKARTPAYVLEIDFGPSFGRKRTSAQVTANYDAAALVGRQVTAIVNLPPKNVAGIVSEVRILGAICPTGGTVLLTPTKPVENGAPVD